MPESWDFRFPKQVRWAPLYAAALVFAYLFMNGAHTTFLNYQF